MLSSAYGFGRAEIATAIRRLAAAPVVHDAPATEAGLALLEAGGDFADGAMAEAGARLGGARFTSFDRKAARLLAEAGHGRDLLD